MIIAHRMRTVDGVDKIVVLKDGVVAESGTPEELKAQNGIYKHMIFSSQYTQSFLPTTLESNGVPSFFL